MKDELEVHNGVRTKNPLVCKRRTLLMKIRRNESVNRLKALMSDISERCWCAGWLVDTEYVLWDAVINGPIQRWGQDEITEEDTAALKVLSDEIGGWIGWKDEKMEPSYVPMSEWLKEFEDETSRLLEYGVIVPRLKIS
jgi:hypothetical protein